MTLAELNACSQSAFVERLGALFEHSPWVAERAWRRRPFSSIETLHEAMMRTVAEAKKEEQLALLRAHPELAGAQAKDGRLTQDSSTEQGRLGFTRLEREELERISRLNREYRDKHGFPCIVALRLHAARESVMAEMERRLANETSTELKNALGEIGHIARGRLARILEA